MAKKEKKKQASGLRQAASFGSGALLASTVKSLISRRRLSGGALVGSIGLGVASTSGLSGRERSGLKRANTLGFLGGLVTPSGSIKRLKLKGNLGLIKVKRNIKAAKIKKARRAAPKRTMDMSSFGGMKQDKQGKVIFRRIRGRLTPIRIQK